MLWLSFRMCRGTYFSHFKKSWFKQGKIVPNDKITICDVGTYFSRRNMSGRYFLGRKLWVTLRDNYSKQRPDIENLFTHPWSVSIGKTAIFVFKLLSFYVEWSDQHKFYMKLKEKLSTLKSTSETSISKTKMLWNLIFLCKTSSIFTT